jgi:hypothetical protein
MSETESNSLTEDEPPDAAMMAEVRAHFNEPIICGMGMEVVRCVGYGESAIDCYLIYKDQDGKLCWNTMVGGYHWLDRLKGQCMTGYGPDGEAWDDFYRIDSFLELNGCPKEPEFIVDMRHDDWEGGKPWRAQAQDPA